MRRHLHRRSIAMWMALVGLLAAGLGAMRNGSDLAERGMFTALLLALGVGLLGAIVRRGAAAWVGFALFGWGYFVFVHYLTRSDMAKPVMISSELLLGLADKIHSDPGPEPTRPAGLAVIEDDPTDGLMPAPSDYPQPRFLPPAEGPPGNGYEAGAAQPEMPTTRRKQRAEINKAEIDKYRTAAIDYRVNTVIVESKRSNTYRISESMMTLLSALLGAFVGTLLRLPPTARVAQTQPQSR